MDYHFSLKLPTVVFVALSSFLCTCHGFCNQLDRDSLSSFNLSISAASPLNWSLSADCCSWEGVGCDNSGRVTNLRLPSRGLKGSIPASIVNLTSLSKLDLSDNDLTGTIPQVFGRLSNLEKLQLDKNRLSGTIPASLGNCTRITTLILKFNYLGGELSGFDFSKFVGLRTIDLGFNFFTGALPASLFRCKTLRAIRLSYNNLTGEILPNMVELQSLSLLAIARNNLTNIRSAMTILMGCRSLRVLALLENFYDEEMPGHESLIQSKGFQNLQVLTLAGSRLTGFLPRWLSKLTNLAFLGLSRNCFTGSIPGWIGELPNLFHLDLSSNQLSGQFPLELTRLRRLSAHQTTDPDFELPVVVPSSASYLQYNRLSSFPPALRLGNNSITGTIPPEIGRLKFLTILDLNHNNFSGSIPDTFSNLSNLEVLDLSGNHLSGEIPASLRSLDFLSTFIVANNNLQGPIPTGHQFDTFQNSSFVGNPGLCGRVLQRSCQASPSDYAPRKGHRSVRESFNWLSFEIGYVFSLILTVIAVLKFFWP